MTGKKKINIVDIVIIISLLLIIATVIYRAIAVNNADSSSKEQKILYTLTSSAMDVDYKDYLQEGDKLYLYDSNSYCGEITELSASYVKEYTVNDDGTKEEHINPSRIYLTLTVEVSARATESKMFLGNGVYLIPGQELKLHTKTFSFSGKLNSFSPESIK